MKKIEAIIRKTKFEEVKAALLSSDIDWFEYHRASGYHHRVPRYHCRPDG